ncbi:MAG: hypothetical protein H0Z28_12330 [Archaeoglobus sp.]|nr:hypothetical protein [Archaeoglobus sp.]
MQTLSAKLKKELDEFVERNDFARLYKGYEWRGDNWRKGFTSILKLELNLARKRGELDKTDVAAVLRWGGMRNLNFSCPERIKLSGKNAALDARTLQNNTKGLGPSSISRILHFSFPESYGSLETLAVRAFGKDGARWIRLRAFNHGSWYIPKTKN